MWIIFKKKYLGEIVVADSAPDRDKELTVSPDSVVSSEEPLYGSEGLRKRGREGKMGKANVRKGERMEEGNGE